MEIKFADSFFKSLEKMRMHNTWWYKTYELFRRGIPRFVRNIWTFRKALWNYYWWDYSHALFFLQTALEDSYPKLEKHGHEADSSRLKKVAKMKRAAILLAGVRTDRYIDMAEAELGELRDKLFEESTPEEREHDRKVFLRADEIEKAEWQELWYIMRGQNTPFVDFDKEFDGTNCKTWWD